VEFRFGADVVRVNMPDAGALLAEVAARLARGEGFALATLNLDHLEKLGRLPAFRAAYAAHDLVVADGHPVVWLARLAGRPVRLAPGADLVLPLARAAAAAGAPVALVGSTAAALDAAAARMRAEVPGLALAARLAPPMGFDPAGPEAGRLLDALGASGARLAFLALGAPKQEMLAARGRGMLPGMGFASVGAGLDFLAGTQRRAPAWMRRAALEWLWRAGTAPRRLGPRYLRNALILPGLVAAALALRGRAARRHGPG
jgi:exopolysaccharide biosynthesis WecB/TagA/CpsF family protein